MTRRIFKSFVAVALLVGVGSGCTKQMQKARYLARADKDFVAERYDRAEIEYQRALQVPPPDAHALERLGIIYYNQGRWAAATVCLNKAIELAPTNSEARLKLGLSELMLQRLGPAREQALTVLTNEPDNMEALLVLAGASYSTQDMARVTQALDKVSITARGRPGYHLVLGALYLHQRDLTHAESEYRQELSIDPKSSQAYVVLGNLFLIRQDLKQAELALRSAADLAPLRSGARLSYAGVRMQNGAVSEALQQVQDLVKKAPDFLPAWLFLARAAAAGGKTNECAAALDKVLARDPVNLEGLTFKGSLLLGRGDATNAVATFERLIKIYAPGPPQVHYNLAVAYSMSGDFKQAAASASRALTMQSNYPEATLLLANLNLRLGDSSAAIGLLSRLVDEHPELAQGHLELAAAYLGQKRYDEAVEVYQRMSGVFTNNAEVPYRLGAVFLAQNKTDEARVAFEKSLAVAPGFPPAVEQLVQLDLNQAQVSAALDRVKALIEKYPKVWALQVLLGRIHIDLAAKIVAKTNQERGAGPPLRLGDVPAAADDVNQAETALLTAIELSPDSAYAYQLLASLYVNSNRQQQALDRMNSLLARTNDVGSLTVVGLIQEQMTNYAGAADTYEKILRTQSNNAAVLNNLAVLCSDHLGQPDRALDLATRARQLQPDSPAIADTLGWILFRRGEYARALSLLSEAADKLPASAEVQCHLGLAQYMLGQEEPARATLKVATSAGNDLTSAAEAAVALRILALDPATANEADRVLLEQRLREVPADPVARVRLAAIQGRDGQIPQAKLIQTIPR